MSSKKARASASKQNRKILTQIIVATLVTLTVFVGLPVGILAFDAANKTTIACTVESAAVGSSSNRSLRGAGTSSSLVVIETADCGRLQYRRPATRNEAENVAQQFSKGQEFTFSIGAASSRLRPAMQLLRITPEVAGFTEAQ